MTILRGRHIEVIAPSGAHLSLDEFDRAAAWFRERSLRVTCEVPRQGWQRFSAPDDERLAGIHRAASREDLDAVMITRGGYGLSRLLDRIDWAAVAASVARGCRWIGYSDFTVFHLGLLAQSGAVSWAGPTFSADFGGAEGPDPYTQMHFESVIGAGRALPVEWSDPQPDCGPGVHEGVLWGGNLSMLCSVAATRWCPDIEGGLLFIEDINEHPYRIERMLHQLDALGILRRQAAIIVGDCSGWRLSDHDQGYGWEALIDYWRNRIEVPIVTGLPFGHIRAKAMLGVGLRYRLSIAGAGIALEPRSQS